MRVGVGERSGDAALRGLNRDRDAVPASSAASPPGLGRRPSSQVAASPARGRRESTQIPALIRAQGPSTWKDSQKTATTPSAEDGLRGAADHTRLRHHVSELSHTVQAGLRDRGPRRRCPRPDQSDVPWPPSPTRRSHRDAPCVDDVRSARVRGQGSDGPRRVASSLRWGARRAPHRSSSP
jgi:hypothetical protein